MTTGRPCAVRDGKDQSFLLRGRSGARGSPPAEGEVLPSNGPPGGGADVAEKDAIPRPAEGGAEGSDGVAEDCGKEALLDGPRTRGAGAGKILSCVLSVFCLFFKRRCFMVSGEDII